MLYGGFTKMNIVGACRRIEFQFGKHFGKSVIAMAPAGFMFKQYVGIEETAFKIAKFYIDSGKNPS